jgi:hypothetical protein
MKRHPGLIVLTCLVGLASLAGAQTVVKPAIIGSDLRLVDDAVQAPLAPAPPAPAAVAPALALGVAPPAPLAPAAPPQAARPAAKPKAPDAPKPPDAASAPAVAPQPEPPGLPPPGRERGEPDPVNVRFEVTVESQAGTNAPVRRQAMLTVSNGTGFGMDRAVFRAGNNVAVPSTTFTPIATGGVADGATPPAAKPMTSYSYRSVGLNVDVRQAIVIPGNRVRATLSIEFSGVEKEGSPTAAIPPSFPTFSQSVALYFDSGKPVLIAQSSDPATSASQKVEVKATILR